MDNKEWFKEAKFGMMVHFGLYSLLGGEWKGKRTDWISEWIRCTMRIPRAEYHKLLPAFNPVFFDADEWVTLAKDAGMKYIVVTAKHHEGFCLYKSEVDDFNCVTGTPFGRDIIGEIAEAAGFTDASYFAKSFKATFGMTPKEYRAQYSEDFI